MKPYSYFPKRISLGETNEVSFAIETLPLKQPKRTKTDDEDASPGHFELIWVTKGEGDQWIDLQNAAINNEHILCLRPGQVHRFESSDHLQGYVIRLGSNFLNSIEREVNSLPFTDLLQLFSTTKGININEDTKAVLHELIFQMQKVLSSNELLKTELLKCYIEIFIIHLNHQWDGPMETRIKTRNMELVQSFMSLLEKNFKEERMVAEYAAHLAVTPNYLNEIVKKTTGYSAGHLIRQRVGLEAKRKALHTGMCMKEVAYSLGFSDQAHFSKFFKNATGKNFSDFRKERLTLSIAGMRS